MVVRQRFSGFQLQGLTSLFGAGDSDLVDRSVQLLARRIDPGPDLDEGARLVREIITTGRPSTDREVEDELLQYVVAVLAEFEQIHDISQSVFWEPLMMAARSGRLRATGEVREILDWLLKGRPLFGKRLDPEGVCYSYLSNREAGVLFEFLLGHPGFRGELGWREVEPWMQRILKSGKDVWVVTT
jgi:hypothetical protein